MFANRDCPIRFSFRELFRVEQVLGAAVSSQDIEKLEVRRHRVLASGWRGP
jgi:hypothetical protein